MSASQGYPECHSVKEFGCHNKLSVWDDSAEVLLIWKKTADTRVVNRTTFGLGLQDRGGRSETEQGFTPREYRLRTQYFCLSSNGVGRMKKERLQVWKCHNDWSHPPRHLTFARPVLSIQGREKERQRERQRWWTSLRAWWKFDLSPPLSRILRASILFLCLLDGEGMAVFITGVKIFQTAQCHQSCR